MEGFSIKIEGLEELNRALGRVSQPELSQRLRQTMKAATNITKQTARSLVPADTGALKRSISDEVIYRGGTDIEGVVEPKERYAMPVEKGARPHFVPVGSLERWAKKRGINPWALAMSISKKGTKAQPYIEPTFHQVKRRIIEMFADLVASLIRK